MILINTKILQLQPNETESIDTYVVSSSLLIGFSNSSSLICGRDSVGSKYRILIKPILDQIPATAKVTRAEIRLCCNSANNGIYNVYMITSSWSENIGWLTMPTYNPTPFQTLVINGVVGNWYIIDILSLMQSWQMRWVANNGILIKSDENSINKISFFSSNYAGSMYRPIYYYEFEPRTNMKHVLLKESFKGNILL